MKIKRMPQELADEILNNIKIEYSQKEVEHWYENLPDDTKSTVKDFAKSFSRIYPNHTIYAFNFYMQLADKTIAYAGSSIVRLFIYDDTYNNKLNNSKPNNNVREEVVHREPQQDVPYPGERIFNYLQGFVRTPYAEYQAFASMRDMGSNMEKIISRLDNIERK